MSPHCGQAGNRTGRGRNAAFNIASCGVMARLLGWIAKRVFPSDPPPHHQGYGARAWRLNETFVKRRRRSFSLKQGKILKRRRNAMQHEPGAIAPHKTKPPGIARRFVEA